MLFLLAAGLGLLWASAFPLITLAGAGLPIFTVVALRLVVAAAFLCTWRFVKTRRWGGYPVGCGAALLVLAVLGNNIPFSLITAAQRHIPSGESALIIALVPSFSMILAPFFLADEPFRWRRLAGTLLGLAGVGVLLAPHLQESSGQGPLFAYGLVILTALSYGGVHVAAKYYQRYPALDRAAGSMLLAAMLAVPLALWHDKPWHIAWPLPATLATVGLGIFPSALANLVFFAVVGKYGTVFTGFAGYTVPVFGVVLGAVFLGEPLTGHLFLALALILLGMVVARR